MRYKPRSGTDDLINFQNVVLGNEYQLPASFAAGTVIIDIGAHTGNFTMAALMRGTPEIYCYEPEPSNYGRLCENVQGIMGIYPFKLAVWRSDGDPGFGVLHFTPSEQSWRTGGGNTLLETGDSVQCVPFDVVIDHVSKKGARRIDLVKMDCEGAEWPILLTATKLDLIDKIYGEYHEIGGPNMGALKPDQVHPREIPQAAQVADYKDYTVELLWAYLSGKGFSMRYEPTSQPWLGHFWAERCSN